MITTYTGVTKCEITILSVKSELPMTQWDHYKQLRGSVQIFTMRSHSLLTTDNMLSKFTTNDAIEDTVQLLQGNPGVEPLKCLGQMGLLIYAKKIALHEKLKLGEPHQ